MIKGKKTYGDLYSRSTRVKPPKKPVKKTTKPKPKVIKKYAY